MIYVFVKMSSGWYGQTAESVEDAQENIQDHVDNGSIVAIADDKEGFAHDMGINESDIHMA